jgi:hypothetical protein
MLRLFVLPLLCWASIATAQSTQDQKLLKQLLDCSPDYFSTLKQSASILKAAGIEVLPKGSVARVNVKDRKDSLGTNWLIQSSRPLKLGSLRVVGAYDLERVGNSYGALFWGLLVKGEPKSVADEVNRLVGSQHALEFDGLLGYARLKRADASQNSPKWQIIKPLPAQSIPQPGVIELTLEIAPADESLDGVLKLGCSIQGSLTKNLIEQIRPDIK